MAEPIFQQCQTLHEYGEVWLAFPGEPDLLSEIWSHRQRCPVCRANERAFEGFRIQKRLQETLGEKVMNIGMLWFDNSKSKTAEQVIQEAVRYYTDKYQKQPNCAHVSPGVSASVPGIEIKQNRSVLPGHVWIGLSDAN